MTQTLDAQTAQTDQDLNRKARNWFLAWIIGFFLVFMAVDAVFIYIAVDTHTGEMASSKGESAKSKPKFK